MNMAKKKRRYISLLLFFTFLLNFCVPCLPMQAEATKNNITEGSLAESGSFSDIAGHWAEREITARTTRELAGGYPDGTFRPENSITRAEFVTLVNRVFGYANIAEQIADPAAGQASSPVIYHDVAETDWYAPEFANAAAVGYLGGYPDGTVKPQNPITRQEVAVLLARILPIDVDADGNGSSNNVVFSDQAQIPAWSQASIATAVSGGYMNGYPDGTFRPAKAITRAEAVAVLERAAGQLYNRAGTYGPFQGAALLEGNVTINTPGVTLQNTIITGNLYLTEGIGAGDVTLDGVTVQGTTKIAGGGSDSIHLRNSSVGAVLVNVPSHNLVRVLAQGSTDVGTLEARTPAKLEEEGLTGSGFTKVIVKTSKNLAGVILAEGSNTPQSPTINVELLGQFSDVEIQAAAAQLDLQKGSIANLTLSSTAQAAQINLAAQTSINTLTADTPATVQGQGTVETTQANVDGVVIEATAKNVVVADGVQANVAGKTITEDYKYVEPKKKKSRDAALSDLMIDGITVAGFAPDTLSYDVVLPYGTTEEEIPTVTAEAHHAKARITVTQATGLTAPDNTATVVVTAENGRTQTYIVRFTVAESSAKAITAFRFEAFDPEVVGFIDEEANPKTIAVTVPYGTDVTTLVPTIEHTGASISPASGISQNFTDSVTYTVTAADGSTAEYEVTVTIASNSEASLTSLAVNPGTIDFDAGTYTYDDVIVPYGTETVEVTFAAIAGATMDLDSPHTVTITDGVGTFSVEVTAEDGVTKQIYTINFVEAVPVTGVTLDKETVTLAVGEEEILSATVSPADASNQTVTWASSETNVATVDDNGVVTAVGVGEATITVTTEDGNKTDTCAVTVNPAPIDDFTRTGDDGTGATFTWTAADGATSIKIEQSTDEGTTWVTAYTAPIEAAADTAKVVGLTAGATYKFKLVVTGGNNAGDSNIVDVTTSIAAGAAAYGASWDSSADSTTMTRLGDAEGKTAGADFNGFAPWSEMKLCNVADNGAINAYIGDAGFKRDGSNGQVMVKIPKFYYKHTYDEGTKKHEFWVADGPAEGFKLHPVFLRAGVEKPYVLLGAYKASLGRNQTDTVDALASVSGVLPAVSRNITQFRTLAEARGTETGANWTQADALTRNAVALLYLVEYADTNSQSTTVGIGKGITELRWSTDDRVTVASTNANEIIVSSTTAGHYSTGQIIGVGTSLGNGSVCTNRMITGIAATVDGNVTITVDGTEFSTTTDPENYIYHVGQKTGGCDGKDGVSGSAATYPDGVTPGVDGKVSINYRGLEDLWGNVWEFVDGINIKADHRPYVADHGFASDVFDGTIYQDAGFNLPGTNNWVNNFACSAGADWLLMPSAVGANSGYIPDYYYQATGNRVALVGGRWYNGTSAGLFHWHVNHDSSYAYLSVGARLLQIP